MSASATQGGHNNGNSYAPEGCEPIIGAVHAI